MEVKDWVDLRKKSFTTKEAAAELGLAVKTFRHHVINSEPRLHPVGKDLREDLWLKDDIYAFRAVLAKKKKAGYTRKLHPEHYTLPQAAKKLNLNAHHFRLYFKNGKISKFFGLKAAKEENFGTTTRVYFAKSDVDAIAKARGKKIKEKKNGKRN